MRAPGLQLDETNRAHTPHNDIPYEACKSDVEAQHEDMVRLGLGERGATHAL